MAEPLSQGDKSRCNTHIATGIKDILGARNRTKHEKLGRQRRDHTDELINICCEKTVALDMTSYVVVLIFFFGNRNRHIYNANTKRR